MFIVFRMPDCNGGHRHAHTRWFEGWVELQSALRLLHGVARGSLGCVAAALSKETPLRAERRSREASLWAARAMRGHPWAGTVTDHVNGVQVPERFSTLSGAQARCAQVRADEENVPLSKRAAAANSWFSD